MFIQCSDCDYKYIVNSADLKPDGRMVECANCNHRWYQEPLKSEEFLSSSVPKLSSEESGICLLYTSPSPRDGLLSRMPSSA